MTDETNTIENPASLEEFDTLIWQNIISWLNSQSDLPESVRNIIAKRAEQLRLKMQVLFMELQRKHIHDLAMDVEFEAELRRELRKSYPFLDAREKAETLKTLISTNEDRLKRLENQLQGFDLFSNVAYAIQTMSNPVPTALSDKVKQLSPLKRQQLLQVIDEIKSKVEQNVYTDLNDVEDVQIIAEPIKDDKE